MKDKLERCGFCGTYFSGDTILQPEELKKLTKKQLDEAPLGYCPNAEYEDSNYEAERRVTKDMASDAGMPELEGQLF